MLAIHCDDTLVRYFIVAGYTIDGSALFVGYTSIAISARLLRVVLSMIVQASKLQSGSIPWAESLLLLFPLDFGIVEVLFDLDPRIV